MNLNEIIGEATDYDKKVALEVKKPKSWCKSVSAFVNILATRNHKSGNLEIGVPVLRNRLFCA